MRKISLLNSILSIFLVFLFISCEEEVDTPQADFTASLLDSDKGAMVKFTDNSTKDPTKWEWTFEGGIPNTSKEQNPTVRYTLPGIFDVTLVASNEGGKNEIIRYSCINMASIRNNLHTEAKVITETKIKYIPSYSSINIALIDNSKTACYIETSGKNQLNEQIGLLISWEFDINLNHYYIYELGLSSDLVFFNLTNNSDYNFTHFQVNCGNSDYESLEETVIPNDGNKYGVGYYIANTGMEVRTYFPEGYIYWIEDYSFYMPWTNNQAVDLEFGKSGKTVNKKIADISLITPDISNLNISIKNEFIKSSDGKNVRFITQSKLDNQDL